MGPRLPPTTLIQLPVSSKKAQFGSSWRDQVGDIRGFEIHLESQSLSFIRNLPDVACQQPLYGSGVAYYFVLLQEEYILKLEVFSDDTRIHSLRLHTNTRVSQWYGKCTGTYSVHNAPDGQFFRSMYGDHLNVFNCSYCVHLGVHVESLDSKHLLKADSSSRNTVRSALVFERGTASVKVDVTSASLRAVAVKLGRVGLADVTVLSEDQYQGFVSLTCVDFDCGEHWFVLAPNETIVGVAVSTCSISKHGERRIDGLRFRTNLRLSIWFGTAGDKVTWLDDSAYPGAVICGFQLEGKVSQHFERIDNIGVIYKICKEN